MGPATGEYPNIRSYELGALLGAGGAGVVYEAFDQQRRAKVAVKFLVDPSPEALQHFKQEFRRLADLEHPNLVTLYELGCEGGRWFFSMELVPGAGFLDAARSAGQSVMVEDTLPGAELERSATPVTSAPVLRGKLPVDAERLAQSLTQLLTGLATLHRAGIVHCDIKPANVRVRPDGRVVILDFGLAAAVGACAPRVGGLAGTLSFMAPERMRGEPATPASDIYSVGVMLYAALTGALPFSGDFKSMLRDKSQGSATALARVTEGTPSLFSDLCRRMLAADSSERITVQDALQLLGASATHAATAGMSHASVFAGRTAELGLMHKALATVEADHPALVMLSGEPGSGKSTLLKVFHRELTRHSDVTVLSARCREQESVPFKALDPIVDALADLLVATRDTRGTGWMPRQFETLTQAFPVLRSAFPTVSSNASPDVRRDPASLRRCVSHAFRDLIARLAERRRVVLLLDDVQWGDADSASILGDLLAPPDAPAVLCVLSRRSAARGGPFLETLSKAHLLGVLPRWEIELGPLSISECLEVARGISGTSDAAKLKDIAESSRGNPYFLKELAASSITRNTLEDLLKARIQQLDPRSQRLLNVVCTFGKPAPFTIAFRAADLQSIDPTALTALRTRRLISNTGIGQTDTLEPYHDRVRETVLSLINSDERRRIHLRLAECLEDEPEVDPELLGAHLEAAGDAIAAGRHLLNAARTAAKNTAFHHAARLLASALPLVRCTAAERGALETELAEALANAGRSAEAAKVFSHVANSTPASPDRSLRRRAAYHYCISGYVQEASAEFEQALAQSDLWYPKTLAGTLASLFAARTRLRLRGFDCQIRSAEDVSPELLEKVDTALAATAGFALIDVIRAAAFSSRTALLALQAGEPGRLLSALALESCALAVGSAGGERRAEEILTVSASLAEQSSSERARALVRLANGLAGFSTGQWIRAKDNLEAAENIFVERCIGANWELSTARYAICLTYENMGDFAGLRRKVESYARIAEEAGDLYLGNSLRGHPMPLAELADGFADRASAILDQVDGQRNAPVFLPQVTAYMSRPQVLLYADRPQEAWEYVSDRWSRIKLPAFLYGANCLAFCLLARISAAVAAAPLRRDKEKLLSSARRDLKRLQRLHPRFVKPMSTAAAAAISAASGDTARAAHLYTRAAVEFDSTRMLSLSAACKRQMALLSGPATRDKSMAEARALLAECGVRDADRFADATIPCWRPGF